MKKRLIMFVLLVSLFLQSCTVIACYKAPTICKRDYCPPTQVRVCHVVHKDKHARPVIVINR